MNGIRKQALFYRGYLTDERSLAPVTMLLACGSRAHWLAVYLVGVGTNAIRDIDAAQNACVLLFHTNSLTQAR